MDDPRAIPSSELSALFRQPLGPRLAQLHGEGELPGLQEMFAGADASTLRRALATQAPLHRPSAGAAPRWYDRSRFAAAVVDGLQRGVAGFGVRASFDRGPDDKRPMIDVQSDRQIPGLLDVGATLCVTSLHLADPRLLELATQIKRELGFCGLVGFNAYLSTSGCGFSTHWDPRTACSIQIEGDKEWHYARRPALAYPVRAATHHPARASGPEITFSTHGGEDAAPEDWEADASVPQPDAMLRVTMRPGDMLMVPAGAWHAACAQGPSLALNCYFEHPDLPGRIGDRIAQMLRADAAWRCGPPLDNQDHGGAVPESVTAYFQRCRDTLLSAVEQLCADASEFHEAWTDLRNGPPRGVAHRAATAVRKEGADTVVRRSQLRVPQCALTCWPEADALAVTNGRATVQCPAVAGPLLHRLLPGTEFCASQADEWCPEVGWANVQRVLQALVEQQILEVA